MHNIKEACQTQKAYCDRKHYPYFAPPDGRCYRCGRNIYDEGGYTVETAGNTLITGCPFCHYSYCE